MAPWLWSWSTRSSGRSAGPWSFTTLPLRNSNQQCRHHNISRLLLLLHLLLPLLLLPRGMRQSDKDSGTGSLVVWTELNLMWRENTESCFSSSLVAEDAQRVITRRCRIISWHHFLIRPATICSLLASLTTFSKLAFILFRSGAFPSMHWGKTWEAILSLIEELKRGFIFADCVISAVFHCSSNTTRFRHELFAPALLTSSEPSGLLHFLSLCTLPPCSHNALSLLSFDSQYITLHYLCVLTVRPPGRTISQQFDVCCEVNRKLSHWLLLLMICLIQELKI